MMRRKKGASFSLSRSIDDTKALFLSASRSIFDGGQLFNVASMENILPTGKLVTLCSQLKTNIQDVRLDTVNKLENHSRRVNLRSHICHNVVFLSEERRPVREFRFQ